MNLTIRQALPSDASLIHTLLLPYVEQRLLLDRSEAELIELTRHGFIAECTDREPKMDEAQHTLQERIDSIDDGLNVIALDATAAKPKRCVGFAAVEIYSSKLAELQCLAVHSDFRRSGVGKQLVEACLDRARELQVMEVLAISSSEEFLQSCGFDFSLPDQKKALFCQLRPRQ